MLFLLYFNFRFPALDFRSKVANFILNEEDSTITVPSGPGLGIEVDEERLAAVTIRKSTFGV